MSTIHPVEALPPKETTKKRCQPPEIRQRPRFIRYIILIITICCLSTIMANIIAFNFAVLCMPAHHKDDPMEGYDKKERTILFSAVAIGALIALVPISVIIPIIGTKMVFLIAGLLSASSTALIPLASTTHFYFFIAVRVVQGLSFASCMPIVGSVTSSWATLAQNGLFMSVLTTFGQISAIFSMPISGELCESSLGWEAIYYFHSGTCLLFFLAWAVLFYNHPEEHPCISGAEIAIINEGKQTVAKSEDEEKIPYLEILTTPTVWGVWIGALGDLIAVQLVHTFSPLYIRQVLGYSVHRTGFAAAIPVLAQFFVKVFAGHSSDRIRFLSETTKIRIYNSVALGASAIFMVALAFVSQGQGQLGVLLLTLTTAMFGFNGGGFNKCATLVSRQHSHFVLANIQFIWCLSMLLCPVLVALLLPTGDVNEWRAVFLIHAGILVLSNVIFCLLATAKPAPWTKVPSDRQLKRNTPMVSRV